MVPKPWRAVVHPAQVHCARFVHKDFAAEPAIDRSFRTEAEGQGFVCAFLDAQAAGQLSPLGAFEFREIQSRIVAGLRLRMGRPGGDRRRPGRRHPPAQAVALRDSAPPPRSASGPVIPSVRSPWRSARQLAQIARHCS